MWRWGGGAHGEGVCRWGSVLVLDVPVSLHRQRARPSTAGSPGAPAPHAIEAAGRLRRVGRFLYRLPPYEQLLYFFYTVLTVGVQPPSANRKPPTPDRQPPGGRCVGGRREEEAERDAAPISPSPPPVRGDWSKLVLRVHPPAYYPPSTRLNLGGGRWDVMGVRW